MTLTVNKDGSLNSISRVERSLTLNQPIGIRGNWDRLT